MDDPTSATAPEARRRLLVLPPSEIAYFHAILEGYDDLAVMRTLSPEEGLVEVYLSPGAEEDFDGLCAAMLEEGVPVRAAPPGTVSTPT